MMKDNPLLESRKKLPPPFINNYLHHENHSHPPAKKLMYFFKPFIIRPSAILSLFALLLVCLPPSTVLAGMRSSNKLLAGTPPFEIIKKVIKANDLSVKKYSAPTSGFAPMVTWLADPDVQIQPDIISGLPYNTIYNCRNFAAQLENSLGEVDYGILHLHTPVLLITVNSNNQAISFFMKGYRDLDHSIRQDLDHLHLPIENGQKIDDFAERLITNVEKNIDYQVEQAVQRYQERISQGRLTVVGSVADFDNVYKRGAGRLIIININGEKDGKKMQSMTMMKSVSPALRNLAIGRHRPLSKEKTAKEKTK